MGILENNIIKKTGIYGGTFAPPHNGHIYSAEMFIRYMTLDSLIVVPTYIPPHKSIDANDNPEIRLEMAKAAFSDIEKAYVSDYEIKKEGVSYTVDTLEHFYGEENRLYLYCGTDMFLTLDEWKRPGDLMSMAEIVCIRRDITEQKKLLRKKKEYEDRYGARINLLDIRPYPASSTQIREKIRCGADVSDLVPEKVYKIIKKYNLYADAER